VEHFAREGAVHARAGSPVGRLPDAAAVEAIVDAAFWASLLREEGYVPEISLAYLAPDEAAFCLRLAVPLSLGPRALSRLGPAVERPGIHLGVWGASDDLSVWGTTRAIPTFTFVVEVLGPGLLVVKHRTREDAAKFLNVAVFEGDQVKILSRADVVAPGRPALLRSLLAPEPSSPTEAPDDVLLRLAVSMRAHGRGGTPLVVPAGTEGWKDSIVTPVAQYLAGLPNTYNESEVLARVLVMLNELFDVMIDGMKDARNIFTPEQIAEFPPLLRASFDINRLMTTRPTAGFDPNY